MENNCKKRMQVTHRRVGSNGTVPFNKRPRRGTLLAKNVCQQGIT
jgi:hypothetical protein